MEALENLAKQDEIDRYELALQAHLSGDMDADRFQSARLQLGVYGQRQNGLHMVRIKLPGGRLNPPRLNAIADALDDYSEGGEAHITTRQDIQLHYVPLAHTPKVLRRLAQDGLTTREACGNTVRNVTACPLAGVCPSEHVDAGIFAQGVAEHFLRHPLTQAMPRKFKIAVSGCESDCAQGLIHDVGVVAVRQDDGRFGFKVMAGGGLGHKPHEAIVIEPFIAEEDLINVVEAVVSLHNRYSDGTKRAKSRLKFLVDRFGVEGFLEKYREERARIPTALAGHAHPQGSWADGLKTAAPGPGAPRHLFKQKQPGLYVFPVSVPLGQITSAKLRGLARLIEKLGLSEVRTTQDQNLMLLNVPESRLAKLEVELAEIGLATTRRGDSVVTCPGASTCRLGITASMVLGPKLSGGYDDLRLRVSGCHNGCAQPETGDIGIYGEGKRMHGKLIPHYQMYFGGNGSGLGLKGPSIPAARIENAIQRVREHYAEIRAQDETFFHWSKRQEPGYFRNLLADLAEVQLSDVASVARDHGDLVDFKVAQLGGGECGAAIGATVAPAYFEAANERRYRDAYLMQRKYPEALGCAEAIAQLLGQSLLFPAPAVSRDLIGLPGELREKLPGNSPLVETFAALAENIVRLGDVPDEAALPTLFAQLDAWTTAAGEACMEADRQLDLSGMLPGPLSAERRLMQEGRRLAEHHKPEQRQLAGGLAL